MAPSKQPLATSNKSNFPTTAANANGFLPAMASAPKIASSLAIATIFVRAIANSSPMSPLGWMT